MNRPEFHVPPMPAPADDEGGIVVVFETYRSEAEITGLLDQIGAGRDRVSSNGWAEPERLMLWITVDPGSLESTLKVLEAEKCNVIYTSTP